MFFVGAVNESRPVWGPAQWANTIWTVTMVVLAVNCWLAFVYFDLDPNNEQWLAGKMIYALLACLTGMLLSYHRTSAKTQRAGLVLCGASLLYSLFLIAPSIIIFIVIQTV